MCRPCLSLAAIRRCALSDIARGTGSYVRSVVRFFKSGEPMSDRYTNCYAQFDSNRHPIVGTAQFDAQGKLILEPNAVYRRAASPAGALHGVRVLVAYVRLARDEPPLYEESCPRRPLHPP